MNDLLPVYAPLQENRFVRNQEICDTAGLVMKCKVGVGKCAMKTSKGELRAIGLVFAMFATSGYRAIAGGEDEQAAKGLAILEKNCSRCHALGLTGSSRHPQAPPFREVVQRYPVEDLEESLAEGIVSGHRDMPELSFEADQIGAIVAYLNSLKNRKKAN
jgi:cytochrome c